MADDIPDHILLKPGKLDAHERELMKKHPIYGADILGPEEEHLLSTARAIALSHHERWDGTGYPYGLKGEDIPLVGRIVAVADVFDALITARPYKRAFSVEETMEYMTTQSSRHFEPRLIDALVAILPEILKIQARYADELGTVQELDSALS